MGRCKIANILSKNPFFGRTQKWYLVEKSVEKVEKFRECAIFFYIRLLKIPFYNLMYSVYIQKNECLFLTKK